MQNRAEIRRERQRARRGLLLRRVMPVGAVVLTAVLALTAWTVAPGGSDSSASVTSPLGPQTLSTLALKPGADAAGALGSRVGGDAKATASAAPTAGQASGATGQVADRAQVGRAPTSGSFPSGITAGTMTEANAWASFRGRSNDVVVTYVGRSSWNDLTAPWIGSDAEHFSRFPGTWVVSVPLWPDTGGSLATCATGAYDTYFRQFGSWLVSQGRGNSFVRLGWEFNGNWFPWSATTNPGSYVACFRHEASAMRATDPSVRIDWNLNSHNSVGPDAFSLYPGDGYVDVIGVDSYDEYPPSPDATSFSNQCNGTDGLCVVIRFARSHGKLFSVPEWGVVSKSDTGAGAAGMAGGDNPVYVQQMHQIFVQNADVLAYEAYFNDSAAGNVHSSLLNPDENPSAAAAYAALW